ncbi:MAG: alpha/beta hydrolase [Solobacterium sp.]|nr:alpha/beta hydrolase [Solobacterium sp.]
MNLYYRKKERLLSAVSLVLLTLFFGCARQKAEVLRPEPFVLPEETVPYTIQEMPVTLEDRYIYGKAYLPQDGNNTHPTVILAHGMGGSLSQTEAFSMRFAEHGIAAYAFDFCGGGENQSSGDMLAMSVRTEADDLKEVIRFVKEQDFVSPVSLFLLGQSQGGYVCTMCASEPDSDLAGLILMYPAFNINDLSNEIVSKAGGIPDTGVIFDQTVSHIYFEDALAENIPEDMKRIKLPVLILHGSSDPVVPVEYSQQASQLFPNASLILIRDAEHGFFGPQTDEAFSYCTDFITTCLN